MIEQIKLTDIRAYGEARVALSPGMSVFLGPNGNGKTTILEAAYLVGTVRSFRTTKLAEMIRAGAERGVVEAEAGDPARRYRVEVEPNRRVLSRDGHGVAAAGDFTREFTMVALAPDHQEIVTGTGEERRRYLDFTLYTLDPTYLSIAQQYRKGLRQKQALLRSELPFSVYEDRVSPWDARVAELGEEIRFRRRKLIRKLAPRAEELYRRLSSTTAEVSLAYREEETPLADELERKRRTEHAATRALCGPQRDDLVISLQREPAAAVASQGEKASLLLSLKLAELEIVEGVRGEKAVLILDDIGVTLDRDRRAQLFDLLAASPHQALISTPEEEIAAVANRAGARTLSRSEKRSGGGFSVACWGAA